MLVVAAPPVNRSCCNVNSGYMYCLPISLAVTLHLAVVLQVRVAAHESWPPGMLVSFEAASFDSQACCLPV